MIASDWRWLPLSEVAPEVTTPVVRPRPGTKYELWSVPAFASSVPEFVAGDSIGSVKRPVAPDDVLICKINPRLNRVWQVSAGASGPQVASPEWIAVRPRAAGLLEPAFLRLFLSSPQFRSLITGSVSSVTGSHARANKKLVMGSLVPVPPHAVQRRVVDILEDHLARLDAAGADVEAGLRRLGYLRQAILAEVAAGPGVRLGDLALSSGYGTSEKCVAGGPGVPVVRIPNIQRGRVDLADEKRVAAPDLDLRPLHLSRGDVLIIRTNGSKKLIGRSAVVEADMDAAFASYLIRYRLDEERVHPAWVHLALETPVVRSEIERRAASSAGQYNLSLAKLDSLEIPVPSLEAQASSLARLKAQSDVFSRLESGALAVTRRSAALRRALLAAAFSGRLTGHESDLDRAEELIDA